MPNVREPVFRVAGTITELVQGAPASWKLTHDKDSQTHRDRGVVAMTVDGRRVEIVVDKIDVLGEPAVERGAWRDLITRAASRFDPGKVHAFEVSTLEITQLAVDDHAAALGTVVARDPAGNPTRIAATAIARGDKADALIDEIYQASPERVAAREAKGSWAAALPSLACLGGGVAWLALRHAPRLDTLGLPLGLAAAAVLLRPSRRGDALTLFAGDKDVSPAEMEISSVYLAVVFLLMAYFAGFLAMRAELMSWVAGLVLPGVLVIGGLVASVAGGRARTLASSLLRTPWAGGSGGLAVIRGTVASIDRPVTACDEPAALMLRRRRHIQHSQADRSDHFYDNYDSETARSFVIATSGGEVKLSPSDIAWSTSRSKDTEHRKDGRDTYETKVYWLPVGDEIVACGWIDDPSHQPPRLVSRGTEPVVLVTAIAGQDPRAQLGDLLRYWRGTMFGLLVIGAATACVLVLEIRAHHHLT